MRLCDACALKLVDAKLTDPLFKIIPEGKQIDDPDFVSDPSQHKCENCGKPATLQHPQASADKFTQLATKKQEADAAQKENHSKFCPMMNKDCIKDRCMAWGKKEGKDTCRYFD